MIRLHNPALRLSGASDVPVKAPSDHVNGLDQRMLATHILIVEDEAMIAWTMESLLEDMGFIDIAIAASGEDAIKHAEKNQPGLILSDINLGFDRMDGVDAVASIWQGAKPQVVFVSGYASVDARTRINRDIPGARVIRKPVGVDELRQTVIELLKRGSIN